MIKLLNLTDSPHQFHDLTILDDVINLEFRFFETLKQWALNVKYKEREFNGVVLVTGVPLLSNANLPFDVYIVDNSVNQLSPFSVGDLKDRVSVYVAENSDLVSVRGYSVEL